MKIILITFSAFIFGGLYGMYIHPKFNIIHQPSGLVYQPICSREGDYVWCRIWNEGTQSNELVFMVGKFE